MEIQKQGAVNPKDPGEMAIMAKLEIPGLTLVRMDLGPSDGQIDVEEQHSSEEEVNDRHERPVTSPVANINNEVAVPKPRVLLIEFAAEEGPSTLLEEIAEPIGEQPQ